MCGFPSPRIFVFRLLPVGLIFAALALSTTFGSEEKISNLIKCPDCGKDVSRRAVYCPACGCPGSAIAEEANRIADARVLKPIVRITGVNGSGFGAAVDHAGKHVIALLADIGTGEALSLESVTKQNVPYSAIEVAENLPLVRLAVSGDSLAFLPLSTSAETSGFFGSSGEVTENEKDSVAAVDASGNISGLRDRETGTIIPLSTTISWKPIQPAEFRHQASLLAQARAESTSGSLKPETRKRLAETAWASQYFKSTANELLATKP